MPSFEVLALQTGLKTRHKLEFTIPTPLSTVTNQQLPDKAKVREAIVALRAEGMSCREIAKIVGLHFTRVREVLRQVKDEQKET